MAERERDERSAAVSAELVGALKRAGVQDVDASELRRAMYSSDASLYRVPPAAVAIPRHTDEIEAALSVCRELSVPVTMRGAGTSIAGNAVGPGLVLDVSRHLDQVLEVDPEAQTALVQPGVVQANLQKAAAKRGLRFGPDPSTHNRATIGGMIGNNACGSRALGYGRTSDNVVGLDVLTAAGDRLRLGDMSDSTQNHATIDDLRAVVASGLATIRTEFGRFGRQVSGYSLEHLLPENGFDVTKALVGSEGTLALTLAARVRLVRDAPVRLLVVLGYPSMAEAADAVPAVLPHHPVACEGLDARIVDVVRTRRGPGAVPELPRGGGWLFVELVGDDSAQVEAVAKQVIDDSGALDSAYVHDAAHAAALWKIREDGAGLSARTPAGDPAHAGWEDAAVLPERLGGYLREF
ncbi:MAG TPA: FAD-binding oxidoreductase, partial [Actinomycetales bacterium]|nr:FAD-binding oxidoreductase [Actinomycetales bacterium]